MAGLDWGTLSPRKQCDYAIHADNYSWLLGRPCERARFAASSATCNSSEMGWNKCHHLGKSPIEDNSVNLMPASGFPSRPRGGSPGSPHDGWSKCHHLGKSLIEDNSVNITLPLDSPLVSEPLHFMPLWNGAVNSITKDSVTLGSNKMQHLAKDTEGENCIEAPATPALRQYWWLPSGLASLKNGFNGPVPKAKHHRSAKGKAQAKKMHRKPSERVDIKTSFAHSPPLYLSSDLSGSDPRQGTAVRCALIREASSRIQKTLAEIDSVSADHEAETSRLTPLTLAKPEREHDGFSDKIMGA